MKSNRGVTLTSLVVYIMGLVIIVGLMSVFTGYFYKNLNEITVKQNSQEQYTNFLSYLTKDVNSNNLTFVQSGVNGQDCIILKFDNGEEHQYIHQNNNIYYLKSDNQNEKKILLCSNVSSNCVFSYSEGKIEVNFNINDEKFSNSLKVNIGN